MKFEIDWFKIAVAYRAAYRAVQAHGDWEDLVHPITHALLDQLRADPRGASLPKDLGEALEMLLASHAYATRPLEPNERHLLAPYLKTKPESTCSSPVNIGIGDPPPKPPPPPPSVVAWPPDREIETAFDNVCKAHGWDPKRQDAGSLAWFADGARWWAGKKP